MQVRQTAFFISCIILNINTNSVMIKKNEAASGNFYEYKT